MNEMRNWDSISSRIIAVIATATTEITAKMTAVTDSTKFTAEDFEIVRKNQHYCH